jgi:hypothetical protein
MPTLMRGQNGVLLRQDPKIAVTGCKPAVEVLRHSVSGATARIVARVPSAGVLVVGAPGLSRALLRTHRAGSVSVTLALSAGERRFLAAHPGRRLQVRVTLRFKPKHGARLSTEVTLLIG